MSADTPGMTLARPVEPLYSTRGDDPEFEEAIDEFVVRLGETVDALQDAEADGDLDTLAKRAAELSVRASELGYAPMAESAQEVVAACHAPSAELAHKCVAEVTLVGQRIRRGHRTAA